MGYSSRRRLTRWVRWRDGTGHEWHVGLTWARADGQPSALVGLELWATPPGSDRVDPGPEESPTDELADLIAGGPPDLAAITARLLRSFPLQRVAAPAKVEVLSLLPGATTTAGAEIRRVVEARQPRYGHDHYEAVAQIYRDAQTANRAPLVAIQARYRWASHSAVASWVYRCRHTLGLLPPVRPGRPPG